VSQQQITFGVAVAQDDTVWVATDDGVSHIQEIDAGLRLTHYAALHGVTLPVTMQEAEEEQMELTLAERAAEIFAATGLYILCAVLDPTAR
jgi:hypothetical protein